MKMANFLLRAQFGAVDVFCVSSDDTFFHVHVGGGVWLVNIPGGAIETLVTPGNAFHQGSSEGHCEWFYQVLIRPTDVEI